MTQLRCQPSEELDRTGVGEVQVVDREQEGLLPREVSEVLSQVREQFLPARLHQLPRAAERGEHGGETLGIGRGLALVGVSGPTRPLVAEERSEEERDRPLPVGSARSGRGRQSPDRTRSRTRENGWGISSGSARPSSTRKPRWRARWIVVPEEQALSRAVLAREQESFPRPGARPLEGPVDLGHGLGATEDRRDRGRLRRLGLEHGRVGRFLG